MGYGATTFQLLTELRRKGVLAGGRTVLDVGAQEAFLFGELGYAVEFLRAFGVEAPDPEETAALVDRRFVKHLWERVGVEYLAVDFDARLGALPLDLNYDEAPPERRNR